jgi:hypothetical protein
MKSSMTRTYIERLSMLFVICIIAMCMPLAAFGTSEMDLAVYDDVYDVYANPELGIDEDLNTYATIKSTTGSGFYHKLQYEVLGSFPIGTVVHFEVRYQYENTLGRNGIVSLVLYGHSGTLPFSGGGVPYSTATNVFNTSYTVKGAPTNHPVRVTFRGNNSHDVVRIYDVKITYTLPPKPDVPNNLIATTGDTLVNLSWDAVEGADSYNVKRSLTEGGPYTTVASVVYGTTYTDLDVVNGTTYYYIVTAVNEDGESDPSNEASATPFAPEPEPTTGRALVVITMVNGLEKEYDWSAAEVNDFLDWYDARDAGSGPARYEVVKTYNKGPFLSRKDYLVFDKIMMFEIMEYEEE